MFDTLEADIVVMQETKIQRKDLSNDMVLVPGWDVYFSLPKYKKGQPAPAAAAAAAVPCPFSLILNVYSGYSGVAIYTRNSKCCPIRAEEGITGVLCPPNSSTKFRDLPPDQQIGGYPRPGQLSGSIDEPTLDSEGRCVILEFPAFVLIGVYSPAMRDETRTEFRQGFIDALDVRVRNLVDMGKQVFLCGDLNIIREELDTAGLQERLRKEGMTVEDFFSTPSRRFFNQIVFGGRVIGERDEGRERPVLWDLCREFHPCRTGMYTCWDTRKNARPGNFGSRIDYVLCSSAIKDWFIDANIQEGLLGSDHCPVYATIGDTVSVEGTTTHIEDLMNPRGTFKEGKRLREWSTKDLLPTSAKLIPEFNGRQSIRDMFFKKSAPPKTEPQISKTESQSSAPGSVENTAENGSSITTQGSESTATQHNRSGPNSTPIPSNKSSPQKLAAPKRQAEPTTSTNRPQKKNKATLTKEESTKTGAGFAQSSLRGFFKPKTPAPGNNKDKETSEDDSIPPTAPPSADSTNDRSPRSKTGTRPSHVEDDIEDWPADDSKADKPSKTDRVFDPIESKESWSKLLGKRTLPKCEHGEDCQILVTKKAGINCGRFHPACPISSLK